MTTIIQDFKDWRSAKKIADAAKSAFDMHAQQNVEHCHAYPCSCVLSNEYIKIYGIICGGCVKYKKYIQLIQAQKQQKTAKQKLLNNFIFWRQRGSCL